MRPKQCQRTELTQSCGTVPIQTYREIKANRPDIVIKNEIKKLSTHWYGHSYSDRNTSVKATEKLRKYKDLEIEIQRKWGMKAATIPSVIGTLGLITKGMDKYIQKIPGGIRIQELQKITADPWSVPHLKKGTIHQVDFNHVLTPDPRLGLVIQLRSERSERAATKSGFSKKLYEFIRFCLFSPECTAPRTTQECHTVEPTSVFSWIPVRMVSGYVLLWFTRRTMWRRSCLSFTTLGFWI